MISEFKPKYFYWEIFKITGNYSYIPSYPNSPIILIIIIIFLLYKFLVVKILIIITLQIYEENINTRVNYFVLILFIYYVLLSKIKPYL
jgi:hypothetical protein